MRVTVPVSGYFKTPVNPAILQSPVNLAILEIPYCLQKPQKSKKKPGINPRRLVIFLHGNQYIPPFVFFIH
jgi:hypothetical protein